MRVQWSDEPTLKQDEPIIINYVMKLSKLHKPVQTALSTRNKPELLLQCVHSHVAHLRSESNAGALLKGPGPGLCTAPKRLNPVRIYTPSAAAQTSAGCSKPLQQAPPPSAV